MVKKVENPADIAGALSEEEIEALKDAGEIEDDRQAAADGDAAAVQALADADADDAADKAAADEAAAKAAADAKAADTAKDATKDADKAADDDDDDQFLPDFRPDPKRVEAVDQRLTAIETERTALRKQLSDGDIDRDEYDAANEKLADERVDLKAEQMAAQRAVEMTKDQAQQLWDRQQAQFFGRAENEIFREDKDPVMWAALNTAVTMIAKKSDASRSGASVLKEAAAEVRKRFGVPADAVDPDEAKRKAAAARAKQQAEAQGKVPLTLDRMPSAAETDEGLNGDEFDDLDAMLGDPDRMMEAEMRIARMSPAEQARFAQSR